MRSPFRRLWQRSDARSGHRSVMRSEKALIMLILFLLVGLFIVGTGVMSSLDLRYSQAAMSALRLRQIEDTFHANFDRVEARFKLMEKNAAALARLGEASTKEHRPGLRAEVKAAVEKDARDFPEAFGGGIWVDPQGKQADNDNLSTYAYWQSKDIVLKDIGSDKSYDYLRQDWYLSALPANWDRSKPRPEEFYWTPVYYNALSQTAVVSVASFIHSSTGQIVGLATSDLRAKDVIELVSDVDVTPGSFSFLVDSRNSKLTNLSRTAASPATQAVMALLSFDGFASPALSKTEHAGGGVRPSFQTKQLLADGRDYMVFFSKNRAGMIFGVGVPQDEIDSVLEPMRQSNYYIEVGTALVLVVLSGIILYFVNAIMRLLETLYLDPLTGLGSRARLLRDLDGTQQGSLVVLNIDSFKEINDFYGYPCGDQVLRSVAGYLRVFADRSASETDLYRLPSDEFAILMPERLGVGPLGEFMNDLGSYIAAQDFLWEGQAITLNVTQGSAVVDPGSPSSATTADTLLSSANIALKQARARKENYLQYDSEMKIRERYKLNLMWAKRLKAALQDDRIVPFFQPILNSRTGRIEKFECLVRMLDENGQAVSPGEFLQIAKKLRLYRELTRIMVEKSLARFADQEYELSLNVSYEDLTDADTVEFIKEKLVSSRLAHRVTFEILESEGIQNYAAIRSFIDDVKELGCQIAIDDFGSGYSNFEHILRLNADLIKIDGSLIRHLDSDPNAWIVTRNIVQFARDMQMQTVAEFVHSEAIHRKVEQLGIDFIQGAYIGMPADILRSEAVYPV